MKYALSYKALALLLCLGMTSIARADAIGEALEAPQLTFTASNATGPLPAVDLITTYDGVDAVRLGQSGDPQISTQITGPTSVYYRARVDSAFNIFKGTAGESGVTIDGAQPDPFSNFGFGAAEFIPHNVAWFGNGASSPWVLFRVEVPEGLHTLTWWARTYAGGLGNSNSLWLDRFVVVNQPVAPIFTNTLFPPVLLGQASSVPVPFLGTNVTVVSSTVPAGFTLTPQGILSGTGTTAGLLTFQIQLQSPAGNDTQMMTLPVLAPPGPALDTPNHAWTYGGDSPIFWHTIAVAAQDRTDGMEIFSMPQGTTAWMETTVTGPDTMRFFYQFEDLEVAIDGVTVWTAAATSSWKQASVAIPAGSHQLRFVSRANTYSGKSAVDQVHFDAQASPYITNPENIFHAQVGETFTASFLTLEPGATLSFQDLPPGMTLQPATGNVSGTPTASGVFNAKLTATNAFGANERIFQFHVSDNLGEALDLPSWQWTRPQTPDTTGIFIANTTGIGGDSVKCSSGNARLETTVSGPDALVFAYRGDAYNGRFRVLLDGQEITRMTGTRGDADFRDEGVAIPAGTHTLTLICESAIVSLDNFRLLSQSATSPLLYGPRRIFLNRNQALNVPVPATGAGTFSVSNGSLPAGTTLNPATGVITGTATTKAIVEATISLTNASGTHSRLFTFLVADPVREALAPESTMHFSLDSVTLANMNSNGITLTELPDHASAANSRDGVGMSVSGNSTISLTLTGPDTLYFDWRSDSTYGVGYKLDDGAITYVGATAPGSIWRTETVSIPTGTHVVRWNFNTNTGFLDRLHLASLAKPRLLGDAQQYFTLNQFVTRTLPQVGSGNVSLASGTLPTGLSINAAGTISGTPTALGTKAITISTTNGSGTDQATYTFIVTPTLANALDAPTATFTTGGTGMGASGFYSQFATTRDGDDGIATPALLTTSDSTWLETLVQGPARITYWELISGSVLDVFQVQVNGQSPPTQTVTNYGSFFQRAFELPGGNHTVRWTLTRSANAYADSIMVGYLDLMQIQTFGTPTLITPSLKILTIGTTLDQPITFSPTLITVTVQNLPPWLTWNPTTWRLTGTAPATPQETTLNFITTNSVGTAVHAYTLRVTPTFEHALNSSKLVWDISGSSASDWIAQSLVTHDGAYAMQSGTVDHSQKTTLRTTVWGPGNVTFWWKCSSAPGDNLDFRVDSSTVATLTGEADWQAYTYAVPDGPHELHFRYQKDATLTAGQDAGWVDQVTYTSSSFASWIGQRLGSNFNGALLDPDKDGLSNLLEYAFQTDPTIPNASPWPAPTMDATHRLCWDIPKPTGSNGLQWLVESSTTLAPNSWTTANLEILEKTTTRLKVRALTATPGPLFLRLRIGL